MKGFCYKYILCVVGTVFIRIALANIIESSIIISLILCYFLSQLY